MRGVAPGSGVYAGPDGIAMLFSALGASTGDRRWFDACADALNNAAPVNDSPWFDTGWSGRIYARAVCGHLLGDPALLHQASTILATDMPRRPKERDRLDVLGGWSGVLLVLLAAGDMGLDADEQARELADWIKAEVNRRFDDPVQKRSLHRMGFAHGTTGVSYALARTATRLGDTSAAGLARRLADFEEARISKRNGIPGSLLGLGADKTPQLSWCWGVGGYAMARSHSAWESAVGTSSHIDNAAEILATADRDRSHICCGEAGQLMALAELRRKSSDPRLLDAAEAVAAGLCQDVVDDGPWHFYQETTVVTPGLFWGLAGVGYSLLHFANPELLPNFLLLDPASC